MAIDASTPQTASPVIDENLLQAISHHKAGQLREAEMLYKAILEIQPNHPDANHNLGVLSVQTNQPGAGLPYFVAALDADPTQGQYWLSYIDALLQADQPESAQQVLEFAQRQGLQGEAADALSARLKDRQHNAQQSGEKIVEDAPSPGNNIQENSNPSKKTVKPGKPPKKATSNKSKSPSPQAVNTLVGLFNLGRYTEIIPLAQAMANQFPHHEFGWKALGAALSQLGRNAEAVAPMQKAAALSPGDVDAQCNLGVTLHNLGRLEEAETCHRQALKLQPRSAAAHNNLGNTLSDLGRTEEAEASYRRALKIKPDYAEAHNNLGIILHAQQRLEEAEASYRRALEIKHDYADAHNNLGITLNALGRLEEAESCYRRALEIKPDYVDAHSNLGNVLKELNRLDEAETHYRRALAIKPDYTIGYNNLGITLIAMGRQAEAEACYLQALKIKPDYADTYSNLGNLLYNQNRLEEAELCYRRAIELKPDYADAYSNLGVTLKNQGRLGESESVLRRAVGLNPCSASAHYNLGSTLHDLGRLAEAEASYRQALQAKPDYAEAHSHLGSTLKKQGRLAEALACYRNAGQLGYSGARVLEALALPAIMGTRQEMLASRSAFSRNLDRLIEDKPTLDDPLTGVGETNFYLAYHGLNDLDLQIKVAKFYAQACPSLLYTAPHCTRPKPEAQKIRVGFISRFLYNHSVSFCYGKIIEALSQSAQFEVILISSQPIDERIYSGFVGLRLHIPNSLPYAREMLAGLELDILAYLDIGMEPLSYFLAYARLARAQCVLGGHPVTTGIANMDYFLSTDLMEPIDASSHYSEKLVRLPKPLIHFPRPVLPATLKTRSQLNLPDKRHIYMSPMKLQKLHPDFDEALARILQIDANGIIVLFEDDQYPNWRQDLERRFDITIPAQLRKRIVFLPWLNNPDDFISAIAVADVILDPFHFGIGSTAAISSITGTPLVTKAGEFLRGRVGAGFCEMLGIPECITTDTESYARTAVEIASNPALSHQLSEKILKNNSVLYEDQDAIQILMDFFQSLANAWHAS